MPKFKPLVKPKPKKPKFVRRPAGVNELVQLLKHLESRFMRPVALTLVARTDDGLAPLIVTNDDLGAVAQALAAEALKECVA